MDVRDDGVDGCGWVGEDALRGEGLRLGGACEGIERGLEGVWEEGSALVVCEAVVWPMEERAEGAWCGHCEALGRRGEDGGRLVEDGELSSPRGHCSVERRSNEVFLGCEYHGDGRRNAAGLADVVLPGTSSAANRLTISRSFVLIDIEISHMAPLTVA